MYVQWIRSMHEGWMENLIEVEGTMRGDGRSSGEASPSVVPSCLHILLWKGLETLLMIDLGLSRCQL